MGIFINKDTKVIVQGATGKVAMFHTAHMLEYGTNIVGGVTPGKGGQVVGGVPIFNTVEEAVEKTGANASVVFVPARFAADSILEAIKEMDEIMIDRFSSTFEKINIEFNHVFRSLFGGGVAKIKYSDPTNILETGIDIDVQPPGKAVQNITLFSGGEKALIAISCLFAI